MAVALFIGRAFSGTFHPPWITPSPNNPAGLAAARFHAVLDVRACRDILELLLVFRMSSVRHRALLVRRTAF